VDTCYAENGGERFRNVQLFPHKIPNHFAECFMSALVPNVEPYSVGIINDSDFQGQSVFNFRSILCECPLQVAETPNPILRLPPVTQRITDRSADC
jgi:hypothetical protein